MKKIFILILMLYVSTYAVTEIPTRTFTSDTTLTADGDATFRIVGDITIASGATLTIEPGVTMNFTGVDTFRILVNGTLLAQGTETDSIIFKHETTGQRYLGIDFFNTTTTSILEYCRIQNGFCECCR